MSSRSNLRLHNYFPPPQIPFVLNLASFNENINKPLKVEIANTENLNSFSQFIIRFSDDAPLLYGSFAILLAIVLGVTGAFLRQLLSKYKSKLILNQKKAN